jgi:raffinose/stachyose/melibiose transport system substrate-binding protein
MENLMLNVRDDCWPTGYQGLAYADTQQLFVTGGAAMFISGSWEIGVFEGLNKNLNMGFFPTPVLNKGDQKWLAMTPAGAYGLRAGLSPEQREAALVFLNFLASPDGAKAQLDLAGQFPSMPNTPAPADPLAQGFFTGGQGTNSPKLTIYWTFQTLNSKQPGAQQLTWEAFQALVNGSMTPEQAAKHIQDGIATWYTPWQNK